MNEGDWEGIAEGDIVGAVLGKTDGGDEGDAVGGEVFGFLTFVSPFSVEFLNSAFLSTFVPVLFAFCSVLLTGS